LWQKIVKAKYLRNKTIYNVRERFNDSPCWKALLKVKDTYLAGRKIKIENGSIARLWKNPIFHDILYAMIFPELFAVCQKQDCTIQEAVAIDFNIPFRRTLRGDLLDN
jgi:hypothetical protein